MATKRRQLGNMGMTQEPTPQSKLIYAAKNLGNRGLANSQGSTVVIYDHLLLPQGLLPLNTEFRFFESAASRTFPFTNLAEGRLPVATGFILERMWFTIMTVDNVTGAVVFETTFAAAGLPGMYKADFSFFNANNRVIKPTPLTKQNPAFNWKSQNNSNEVIHLDTDISIQPLIEFVCSLKTPALVVPVYTGQTAYLGCYGEGAGGILNPRANF
jgi:hypothetical protein